MKLQYLIRDQGGASLLEFTLVLPIVLSLTFGTIQAGLMLWTQIGLQHGVEVASRCASLSDIAIKYTNLNPSLTPTQCYTLQNNAAANASTVKSFAAANSWGTNPPASVFSVAFKPGSCPAGNLVTATYPFTAIQFLYSITLTARSCYPTP